MEYEYEYDVKYKITNEYAEYALIRTDVIASKISKDQMDINILENILKTLISLGENNDIRVLEFDLTPEFKLPHGPYGYTRLI